MYRLDLGTGESQLVTPGDGVQAMVLAHNRWHPTTVLIGLNADNPMLHDVYRLDLETGAFDKIETNPGYAAWLIDSDLAVRGGVAMTPEEARSSICATCPPATTSRGSTFRPRIS